MVMLTGIKAFESRWQSLQGKYPISKAQKQLLMKSMGRLVDNYATQEEIEADLPDALKILFGRLVDAYLNGCWLTDQQPLKQAEQTSVRAVPSMSPAMLAAAQLRQRQQHPPTEASEADTYVVDGNLAATVRRAQSQAAYV